MTADTGTDNFVMVNISRHDRTPVRRMFLMAGFARIAGVYMRPCFTGCTHPIVTTDTVGCDIGMINRSWQPCRGLVTGITFICGWHMPEIFSGCDDTIMAAGTNAKDFVVINIGWRDW